MGQEELMDKIVELEREIAILPEGSITKKKIKRTIDLQNISQAISTVNTESSF